MNEEGEERSPEDQCYKVCVVGNSGVGKSALVLQYCKGQFDEKSISTIGCGIMVKRIMKCVDDCAFTCSFQFWDTAGQERFAAVSRIYYRGAHALVVVFALDKPETLEAVRGWVQEFEHTSGAPGVPVMLIGNKSDLPHDEELVEQATELAQRSGWFFFTTSALNSENVWDAFDAFVRSVFDKLYAERRAVAQALIDTRLHRAASIASRLSSSAMAVPTVDATGEHDGGVAIMNACAPRRRTGSIIMMAPGRLRTSYVPSEAVEHQMKQEKLAAPPPPPVATLNVVNAAPRRTRKEEDTPSIVDQCCGIS